MGNEGRKTEEVISTMRQMLGLGLIESQDQGDKQTNISIYFCDRNQQNCSSLVGVGSVMFVIGALLVYLSHGVYTTLPIHINTDCLHPYHYLLHFFLHKYTSFSGFSFNIFHLDLLSASVSGLVKSLVQEQFKVCVPLRCSPPESQSQFITINRSNNC